MSGNESNSLPIIDWSRGKNNPEDRVALAKSLRNICHEIGFFLVKNHGVDASLVADAFSLSKQFFDLPLDKKKLIDKTQSRFFRGWEAEGAEYTNNRPDIREQIDFWTDHVPYKESIEPHYLKLLGPNQWPSDELLPGFQVRIQAYIDALEKLANEIMATLAIGLELPESTFEDMFGDQRMSLLKLIRYPETPVGEFGVNAHHDTGFLTVLHAGETPGLEVELADGSWCEVPVIENTFVINLGEMLQAITGNYFIATPHRVVTRSQRYSIGYFHGPGLNTPLHRLHLDKGFEKAVAASPRHLNAGFMAPIKETLSGVGAMESPLQASTYGEQVWNYFCRSYPDNVRKYYPQLVSSK